MQLNGMKASWFALMLVIGCASAAWANDVTWPQWRGPDGQGVTPGANVPLEWSETRNVKWKTAIPGDGHSSPVIDGNHIWLTTAEAEAADEADKSERLKVNTGNQPLNVAKEVRFYAVCVELNSGKIVHRIEVLRQDKPQWVHRDNSYASPSPVIEPGRLYCHFGTFGTACVDTESAKVLWTNRDNRIMHENGPGGSPVLVGDRLIFQCDGSDKQFVVALDKHTGKVAWKVDRSGELRENPQLKKAYCTPLVGKLNGRDTVVSPGADWLYGYDPATGKELWKLSYGTLGFSNVARPVMDDRRVYFSTGFMRSQILAVRYKGVDQPVIDWTYHKNVSKIPSPLLVKDRLYFISDQSGVLTVLDANTGDEVYRQRLGGAYAASPIFAAGRIYLMNREGLTTVIAPGDTYKVLAENELDSGFMASPAIAGDALILRTETHLYRIEE